MFSFVILSPRLIRDDGFYISLYVGTSDFNGTYFCNVFALSPNGSILTDYKPINENLSLDNLNSLNSNLLHWKQMVKSQDSTKSKANCKLVWTHTYLSIFEEDEYYPKETKVYLRETGEICMEIFDISKDGTAYFSDSRIYRFISNSDIDKQNISKTVHKLFSDARPSKPSFFKRLRF